MNYRLCVLCILMLATPGTLLHAASLRPSDPAAFFVTPDHSTELRWHIESGPLAGPVLYRVYDYTETVIASGTATAHPNETLSIELISPQGFYEIEFPDTGQRFGVVSLPSFVENSDEFFCIDSALSWLVRDQDTRDAMIRILHRSGIGMSRERFSWSQINPNEDSFQWQGGGRFDELRKSYQDHEVALLEMCHDSPAWIGNVGKYPSDLVKSVDAWQQICRRWRSSWGALEVWNEPDIFFGANLPADQYTALVRTIAYSTANCEPKLPLVAGAVANRNRQFLNNAAENGLLQNINAFSFHTYGRAMAMESLVDDYRTWLAAYAHPAMPLWLTECGRPWPKGTDRPAMIPDQISALDITMKAVEARCTGVARYFAFVFPFYEENDNNFGMMGRHATPLRSMAAYVRLASLLSGKDYVGDLASQDATILRTRVFMDDKEAIAVLYSSQPNDAATLKMEVPILRIEGIDGRSLTVTPDGKIPIPDGVTYVWLDRKSISSKLNTDTSAMRLWRLSKQEPAQRNAVSPIVMRFDFDAKSFPAESAGYRIIDNSLKQLALPIRIFNLSDEAVEVEVQIDGADSEQENAKRRVVLVSAQGSVVERWTLNTDDLFATHPRTTIRFIAKNQFGDTVSQLALDLRGEVSLEKVLNADPQAVRLPIDELSRWSNSIAAGSRMSMEVTPQGDWSLEAAFVHPDRWVYPNFQLPESVTLTESSVLFVRAKCQKPAAVRVFLWEGDTGVGYLSGPILPADDCWHTAIIRLNELEPSSANHPDANGHLDLGQVKRISVGMNSETEDNLLEVSDVIVVAGSAIAQ